MGECVISGTGLWVPRERISNEELVGSLSSATERCNLDHKAEIEAGRVEARDLPSERFRPPRSRISFSQSATDFRSSNRLMRSSAKVGSGGVRCTA